MKRFHLILLFLVMITELNAQFQTGFATYYPAYREGERTASNELYAAAEFTCSHATLPFGTILKVSRADEGDIFVILRVNDRPNRFSNNLIEVSGIAARYLGMANAKNLRVNIEDNGYSNFNPNIDDIRDFRSRNQQQTGPTNFSNPDLVARGATLPPNNNNNFNNNSATNSGTINTRGSNSIIFPGSQGSIQDGVIQSYSDIPNANNSGVSVNYCIQLISYNTRTQAQNQKTKMERNGFTPLFIERAQAPGSSKVYYRLLAGPFDNSNSANTQLSRYKNNGFRDAFVKLR